MFYAQMVRFSSGILKFLIREKNFSIETWYFLDDTLSSLKIIFRFFEFCLERRLKLMRFLVLFTGLFPSEELEEYPTLPGNIILRALSHLGLLRHTLLDIIIN